MLRRTLIGGIVNEEVKVVGFSEVICEDDLLLEVENGYPSAVERDPRLCSLGRELVENGGRHKLRKKGQTKYTQTSTTGGDEKLYCEEGEEKGEGGRRSRRLSQGRWRGMPGRWGARDNERGTLRKVPTLPPPPPSSVTVRVGTERPVNRRTLKSR